MSVLWIKSYIHKVCFFFFLNRINCLNQMTITWTSGYGINEAEPFVEWGRIGEVARRSPAGTLTIDRNSLCGMQIIFKYQYSC